MFGTLFWLTQKNYSHIKNLPLRIWFTFIVFLPMLAIVGVYTSDPSLSRPLDGSLINISIVIYAVYLILYFVLTVFDNLRPPLPSAEFSLKAEQLIGRFRRIEDN